MLKRIVILIIILAVVFSFAAVEKIVINNTFEILGYRLEIITESLGAEQIHISDIESLITFWERQKKILYMVIPHVEIRNIEVYLYQLKNAVEFGKYFEASEYAEVLLAQTKSVPKTFVLCLENIL
ncbi:MAG: DUF4363 family protein [Bacillota bacterium]